MNKQLHACKPQGEGGHLNSLISIILGNENVNFEREIKSGNSKINFACESCMPMQVCLFSFG